MNEEIAWIDMLQRTRWQNKNCSFALTHEAHMMLGAAEYCTRNFDWDLLQRSPKFGCELLDKTIWHRAIQMVLATDFGWDHGSSWLEEFRQQLQWKNPWTVAWYDAARPLAEKVDRRLLWTWLMQRDLIENWPGELVNEQEVKRDLSVYLILQRRGEYLPPSDLDCMIEIRLQHDSMNQPVPTRLTYRKRTPDENETRAAGVAVQWR